MKSLIDANPSRDSTLGVAIVRVLTPPSLFTGGNVDFSFAFATKNASISFYFFPNPSTPTRVSFVSPSEVSELGGRTVQLETNNLQIVSFASNLECFFGSTTTPAEVLDAEYFESSATVVVLVPPLLPWTAEGTIGPKTNVQNRGKFLLNVLSSVSFVVDPFRVFPSTVYQDFSGNISVRMTGVSSQASIAGLTLLLRSFLVPRSQMHLIAGEIRSATSQNLV